MLFNSFPFAIFFPVVTLLYFILPHKLRLPFLLIASCIFYMAFIPAYILILAVLIFIDYTAGILIEGVKGKERKLYLIVSLAANIGFLAFFKYFHFINDNVLRIAAFFDLHYPAPVLQILLPIGLSFHTFQAMSYTIEVYRSKQKAERNLLVYALYVMFYPQLVAGPIERPQNLMHQFYEKHEIKYQRIADGLKLMAWGLFKKAVIADRLALAVNQIYMSPSSYEGIPLILATVFFAFQVYCDFSGYSDIAIGAAQVMGFRLMANFKQPYLATSISELWRRWHISLSTWMRDYVYMPFVIKFRDAGVAGTIVAVFLMFTLIGIWHGPAWKYAVFGILQGIAVVYDIFTVKPLRRLSAHIRPSIFTFISILTTFAFWCFSVIFFRANNVSDGLYIAAHLFKGVNITCIKAIRDALSPLAFSNIDYVIVAWSLSLLFIIEIAQGRGSIRNMLSSKPAWARWTLYYGVVFSIIFLGVFKRTEFIYFQF